MSSVSLAASLVHAHNDQVYRCRPASQFAFVACLVGAAAALSASDASAQRTGWAVDRFEPAPAGDRFFSSHFPTFPAAPLAVRVGVVNGYANRSLVAVTLGPGGAQSVTAIEHTLVTHFQLNVLLAQRLGLDFSLPVYWMQTGSTDPALPVRAVDGAAVGDPRLGVRIRVAGHADRDAFSAHLAATGHFGFLGISAREQNATDAGFRARLFAVTAGRAGAMRWSASAGYHARPGISESYVSIGSEWFANAAIGLDLLGGRFMPGIEAWATTEASAAFQPGSFTAEALLLARASLLDGAVRVGLGAGPGLTQSAGTPAFRALLSIAYTPAVTIARAPRSVETSSAGEPVIRRDAAAASVANAGGPPGTPASGTTASPRVEPHAEQNRRASEPTGYCEAAGESGCSTGDRDGDSILEPIDVCPDTAVGPHPNPERVGCPDGDGDNDGVVDHTDACLTVAAGAVPDPERAGCPLPDRDGDRIADAVDHCPEEPGAPHPDPARNGCPGLVQLDDGVLRILQPIFFAPSSDVIQPRSFPVLEGVAQALQAQESIRRMVIEGHTDDRGNDEINVELSNRRAISVVRWLGAHGVAPARLHAIGLGPTRPRAPFGRDLSARQRRINRGLNRRVEFEIPTEPSPATPVTAAPR